MGIVFGAPPIPPAPPAVWTGLEMTWTGWDGSTWILSDATDGTVIKAGVRGFSMPPIIHHRAAYASVPGARWRGSTVDVREVFWPIQIYSDLGSSYWLEKDRAFWRTLDPTKTGTWKVIAPDGTYRQLEMRYQDDGDMSFGQDPSKAGWQDYGITFAAEQPFWAGQPQTDVFDSGTPSPFFSSTGQPYVVKISPGGTFSSAKMNNPGDVDAYLVWRIYGPTTTVTVGINGRNIVIPFAIADGQMLEIDTNPRAQTAMQGSIDKTPLLGAVDFAPLPAGKTSTLSLSMTGTGTITATLVPLYYRAW